MASCNEYDFLPKEVSYLMPESIITFNLSLPTIWESKIDIDAPICRTCHEGDAEEPLLTPCWCSGTQGYLHKSCIEKWLATTGTNHCELCRYEFKLYRKPVPFKQWLKSPSKPRDRRNLVADFVCFLILSPLAGVSTYLCMAGALQYLTDSKSGNLEAIGLIILTLVLLIIYCFWCCVSIRYHSNVWREYNRSNTSVTLILDSKEHVQSSSAFKSVSSNSKLSSKCVDNFLSSLNNQMNQTDS